MRFWLYAGIVFGASFSQAQESPRFQLTATCPAPVEQVICLEPSGRLQFGLAQGYAPPWALGGLVALHTQQEGVEYRFRLGAWFEGTMQWSLLEAFASATWGEFELSYGKRTHLGGPWDETLMGRDGRWGVFARYRLAQEPLLRLELAYLPHAGLAGGEAFAGVRYGLLQAGSFVEVLQTPNGLGELEPALRLNPRLGLQGRDAEIFWQLDRGFWARAAFPLPLGQALGTVLPCPCEADTEGWLQALNQGRFELSLWWNPEWNYLGENSPFLPEERLQAWLQQPRKLLLGMAYSWNEQLRLAVDLSRAPVEAVRFYVRYQWR
ncbi:hypothetical protein [Meiothermus sp.]|uniref:hypothetical protein n=1 Tax=Meiothermus sp. TaxID=1955249 RepID=UPI0021DEE105|nr:hypothetical protein [Meiothermus sp.]GIW24920.1 MAG: hypothetical protein KatS3mg069_1187 [Meiothermus sp.]